MPKKFNLEDETKEIDALVGISDIERTIRKQEAISKDYFYQNFKDLNEKPVNKVIAEIYKNTEVKAPEVIKRALVALKQGDKDVAIYEPEASIPEDPSDKNSGKLDALVKAIKELKDEVQSIKTENSEIIGKAIEKLEAIAENTKGSNDGTAEMLSLMKDSKKSK